jgi:hypothetical protein
MRYNKRSEDESPKTVSGEQDPLTNVPENISEYIMNSTHDLTIYLGQRAEFFKKNAESTTGSADSVDFSTCALIERLAFYETMINSLIGVTKRLEERLGGVEGGDLN